MGIITRNNSVFDLFVDIDCHKYEANSIYTLHNDAGKQIIYLFISGTYALYWLFCIYTDSLWIKHF